MEPAHTGPGRAGEHGVALIVGLVILAVLSMIGVAAFSITTQEERMAGNSRDRIRAFEAAEAALRTCEDFVVNNPNTAFALEPASGGLPTSAPAVAGMYLAPVSSTIQPLSESQAQAESAFWQNAALVNQLPTSLFNNGSVLQPSCVVEQFTLPLYWHQPGTPLNSLNSVSLAHVTAHGYGLNPNTVVRLESYYAM